mgnify:CR=1 FL=1
MQLLKQKQRKSGLICFCFNNLSEVGITLSKRVPGFDPRNYKYQKLRQLIESFDAFETKAIPNPHNKLLKIVYVKEKEYS